MTIQIAPPDFELIRAGIGALIDRLEGRERYNERRGKTEHLEHTRQRLAQARALLAELYKNNNQQAEKDGGPGGSPGE